MTKKIYYESAYIKEFQATVISCVKCDGGYDVVLDQSAFFPEEGGQYSDTGTLNGFEVTNVYEKENTVHHICASSFEMGKTVKGKINFEERFETL